MVNFCINYARLFDCACLAFFHNTLFTVSAHPPQTLSFFGFLSLFENPDNLEDENSIVAGMKNMMKQNEVDVQSEIQKPWSNSNKFYSNINFLSVHFCCFRFFLLFWYFSVYETGVSGAKNFFAAKINAQSQGNKAAKEIRKEQEERKVKAEEEKQRKSDFKARMAKFNAKWWIRPKWPFRSRRPQ